MSCLLLGVGLVGGCLEERLVWSPDGRVAALIAAQGQDDPMAPEAGGGLYLCDAGGHLSALQVPQVYRVAWLSDSQRLILARTRALRSSAELAAALGQARAETIAVKAELAWQKIQAGDSLEQVSAEADKLADSDLLAEVLYLRERHGAALEQRFGKDWRDVDKIPVRLHSLVLGKVENGHVEIGTTLYEDTAEINEIRPSPNDRAIAFTHSSSLGSALQQALVVPTDGSAPAVLVAERAGKFPEWTRDSRALVYLQSDSSGGSELYFGTLMKQEVLDPRGSVALAGKADELAALIFDPADGVRRLHDGRIVFPAPDVRVPEAKFDRERREQLFAVGVDSPPALVPLIPQGARAQLPSALAAFAISPDGDQILFPVDDGDVCLFTIPTGKVEKISASLSSGGHYPAPAWRSAGEFSYSARVSLAAGKPAGPSDPHTRNAIVLRRGGGETILTADWSDETVGRFLEDDKKAEIQPGAPSPAKPAP